MHLKMRKKCHCLKTACSWILEVSIQAFGESIQKVLQDLFSSYQIQTIHNTKNIRLLLINCLFSFFAIIFFPPIHLAYYSLRALTSCSQYDVAKISLCAKTTSHIKQHAVIPNNLGAATPDILCAKTPHILPAATCSRHPSLNIIKLIQRWVNQRLAQRTPNVWIGWGLIHLT